MISMYERWGIVSGFPYKEVLSDINSVCVRASVRCNFQSVEDNQRIKLKLFTICYHCSSQTELLPGFPMECLWIFGLADSH